MEISEERLEEYSFANQILEKVGSPWRIGIVIKAWKEELEQGLGGLGHMLIVLKDPFVIDSQDEEGNKFTDTLWFINPISNENYLEKCGNPVGRYPMILDEAITLPGYKD